MSVLSWLFIVIIAAFIDFSFMNNMIAALAMLAGTCLAAYLSMKVMESACENQGPYNRTFKMWADLKGARFVAIVIIITSAIVLVATKVISVKIDADVYWNGVFMSLIPVALAIFIGSLLGVRGWIEYCKRRSIQTQ